MLMTLRFSVTVKRRHGDIATRAESEQEYVAANFLLSGRFRGFTAHSVPIVPYLLLLSMIVRSATS